MSLKVVGLFWLLGVGAIYGMMFGIGSVLLQRPLGWAALAVGLLLLGTLIALLKNREVVE